MKNNLTTSTTVSVTNITPAQYEAITKLLQSTKGKTDAPQDTVSEEEEETFGKKPLSKKDLKNSSEEEEQEEEENEDDEDDEGLDFDTLKAAINKYGEKKPEQMRTILHSFNLKNTKELQQHSQKWEPVYRAVMAKLKKK